MSHEAAPDEYQPGIAPVDRAEDQPHIGGMEIGILGPLSLDGAASDLPRRDGVVLVALAMRPGETVPADRLADAIWGDRLPPSWPKVVQGTIVRLRKILGHEAVETASRGYRLTVPAETVDASRFEKLLGRGRELIATGQPERAEYVLTQALSLWRGEALTELEDWHAGRQEARRLGELRLDAEELMLEAALQAGRHREVLGTALTRVEEAPLRERRWALLALAQYQGGHQADALRTLRQVRTVLARELGLDPGAELHALQEAILRQDPDLAVEAALAQLRPTCPYRGLIPFDVNDADDFFGRSEEVTACLDRLRDVGVLTVVGPSGSGKSSLVRAGVCAALRSSGSQVLVVTPGAHPDDALAGLVGFATRPVLVVDQCEEAVSLCDDPDERGRFFARLVEYAARSPLVLAVRADRIGDLSAYPELARIVERGLYLLNPMGPEELREAIERPANAAGLRLEPGLVDLLVLEVEDEPGALPLLSHALRMTWERREANTLTVSGYRDSGGVRGAVAQSAESVYEAVPDDQRLALRDLLLRLVVPNPDGDPMRSRLPRRMVAGSPQQERLIETLVSARLVTSDDGVIELAHEALVRAWPRLRDWLDEDSEGQRILRHLVVAADTWASMGQPAGELYRGARLTQALEWRDRAHPDLRTVEGNFLDAGSDLMRLEEQARADQAHKDRRANRRLRGLLGVVAVLAIAGLVAATLAVAQRREVIENARQAVTLRLIAGSRDVIDSNPGLAVALAAEGANAASSPQAIDALIRARTAWRTSPGQPLRGPIEAGVGDAQSVSFDADGELLAVSGEGGEQGIVTVWRVASGAPVGEVIPRYEAAFSPSGGFLVAFGAGDTALISRPGDPDPDDPRSVTHDGGVSAIAFHPRQPLLATAGPDGTARVWDLATGAAVGKPFKGHTDAVDAVAFSPTGDWLATAGVDGTVRVWDVATGAPLGEPLTGNIAPGHSVEFHPRAGILAYGGPNGTVRLVDPTTGVSVRSLRTGAEVVSYVGFDSAGDRLVSVGDGGVVQLWDPVTGRQVARLGRGFAVAFDPVTNVIATAGADASVRLWDPVTGDSLGAGFMGTFDVAYAVAFGPDGTLAAAGNDGSAQVWRLDAGEHLSSRLAGHRRAVTALSFSPDGSTLASASADRSVRRWDASRAEAVGGPLEGHLGPVTSVAFSPDGEVIASGGYDGTVRTWDPSDGTAVEAPITDPDGDLVYAVAFSHDGRLIAFGGSGLAMRLYERSTDRFVANMGPVGDAVFDTVAFAPDDRTLATGDDDGRVRLWEVATGKQLHEMQHQDPGAGFVHAVAFSPDGTTLASGGEDGTVRLWDPDSGQPLGDALTEHQDAVLSVAFSADGALLASGSRDGTIRLWDPDAREAVGAPLKPRTGPVNAVAFQPHGRWLASGGGRGEITMWSSLWDPHEACELIEGYVSWSQVQPYLPDDWAPVCRYPGMA